VTTAITTKILNETVLTAGSLLRLFWPPLLCPSRPQPPAQAVPPCKGELTSRCSAGGFADAGSEGSAMRAGPACQWAFGGAWRKPEAQSKAVRRTLARQPYSSGLWKTQALPMSFRLTFTPGMGGHQGPSRVPPAPMSVAIDATDRLSDLGLAWRS